MAENIRVTPEHLAQTAGVMGNKIQQAEARLYRITDLIAATTDYWKGDAADTMRNKGIILRKEAEDLLRRLKLRPIELQNMSDVYARTERENINAGSSLPPPGID